MSPVVAEERIRLQHRLGLVICVSFAALEPVAAHEKPVPVISKGSLPEYMDEEIMEEMAHLENCHFDVHGVVVKFVACLRKYSKTSTACLLGS